MGHGPSRGPGQGVSKLPRVESVRVRRSHGSGRVGSGRVGSGGVPMSRVRSSRVGSGHPDSTRPAPSDPTREGPWYFQAPTSSVSAQQHE